MKNFEKEYQVKWSDVDPNKHLRGSAYLDFTDHTRIDFMESNGLSVDMLVKLNIGFVLTKTTIAYKREVRMNEIIRVDYHIDYFSDDYKKYGATHQVFKENGKLACLVKIEGFWIDLKNRRVTAPPDEVVKIIKEAEAMQEE